MEKTINNLKTVGVSFVLLFISLFMPKILAANIEQPSIDLTLQPVVKTINLSIEKLQDNTGLKYLGGVVSEENIDVFLAVMKEITGDQFLDFRHGQIERDHHQFHITLVNPFEYKELTQTDIELITTTTFSFQLLGLGQVTQGSSQTYFIVADSEQAQQVRKLVGLSTKDFHVTLGFIPQDIYGFDKGIKSLITTIK